MRVLLMSIVALVGAILLGLEVLKDPGVLTIQIRGVSYSTTVAVAAGVAIAAMIAFYILVRIAGRILRAPRSIRRYSMARQERAARRALDRGMLNLASGRWDAAIKELSRASTHEETAVLGYLGYARAAQALGNPERRDQLLQLAQDKSAGKDTAIGITQAQLLMENQELEKATGVLRQLHDAEPKNKLVLSLLQECYLQTHAWRPLAHLVPALEKAGVLSSNDGLHLERNAYVQLLAQSAQTGADSRALDATWSDVPHGLRREPGMLAMYVRALMEHGESARPESMLRQKIRGTWNSELVYLYGLVQGAEPAKQLAHAERWLSSHSEDATLLLTLGRLALRNHMWAKARQYLERSAEIDPQPETYMLLGKLLEQSGDKLIAGEVFRKGLGITVSKSAPLLERNPIDAAPPGLPGGGSAPVALAASAAA